MDTVLSRVCYSILQLPHARVHLKCMHGNAEVVVQGASKDSPCFDLTLTFPFPAVHQFSVVYSTAPILLVIAFYHAIRKYVC
jgi:hypothetical protein